MPSRAIVSARIHAIGAWASRVSCRLERTPHQHVGEVDRNVGDAAARGAGPIVGGKASPSIDVVQRWRAAVASAPEIAAPRAARLRRCRNRTRQSEQVAEHAQHLPRRPRLAERPDDAVEACTRPSQLTNGPAVSANGPTGSRQSAYGVARASGRRSARPRTRPSPAPAAAATGSAKSSSVRYRAARRPCADGPASRGH